MSNTSWAAQSERPAYIVTGPTSGMGRRAAFALARHGTVVLVARDRVKLAALQRRIAKMGRAVPVVCDLSDLASVKRASAEIASLGLPLAGLLNNAGVFPWRAARNTRGWDLAFATNHLGPFALTEALIPHLSDGATVVFVVSAVEDPERKPAVAAGFRGSRYLSAEASARGEWLPGGSPSPGFDAYATSKQGSLVTALEFAREFPRLRFLAVEPGVTPATGLAGDAGPLVRILSKTLIPMLVPLFLPFVSILSTPRRAGRLLTRTLLNVSGETGVYYDQAGRPMQPSTQVRDPEFTRRVVSETRALLAASD